MKKKKTQRMMLFYFLPSNLTLSAKFLSPSVCFKAENNILSTTSMVLIVTVFPM